MWGPTVPLNLKSIQVLNKIDNHKTELMTNV